MTARVVGDPRRAEANARDDRHVASAAPCRRGSAFDQTHVDENAHTRGASRAWQRVSQYTPARTAASAVLSCQMAAAAAQSGDAQSGDCNRMLPGIRVCAMCLAAVLEHCRASCLPIVAY